jgi:hypothetical protein
VGGQDERIGIVEQRVAMASGDSDATFSVERNDRSAVKPSTQLVFPATFFYVLPL